MGKLLKEILPEGQFLVRSAHNRVKKHFTKDYLEEIASNANKMLQSGLRIPAPFEHRKEAKPRTEIEIKDTTASSFDNAGYWEHFFVTTDDNGKPVLKGLGDFPGSEVEPDTPYYKAKNTSKEVSISIADQFQDGLARTWKDAILHVALVNHAVVPGQKEFEEVPDGSSIINMSMMDTDDSEALIGQLKSSLKEAVKISLPDSCNSSTFLRDLLVAVLQIKDNMPNDGQTYEPVPIYMSIGDNMLSKEAAEAIVATKAINPATKLPFTMEELGFKPVAPAPSKDSLDLSTRLAETESKLTKAIGLANAFKQTMVQQAKDMMTRRINAAVANGQLQKEVADTLMPQLDFELSILPTGQFAPHPLETTLSVIESLPAKNAAPAPNMFPGLLQPNPLSGGSAELTPAELEAGLKEFEEFLV